MKKIEKELKDLIIETGRRLWAREYVAANDGNITVKLNDDEFLTTPTGVSKGFMTREMILKVDGKGKVLGRGAPYLPSSEIKMHFEVYRNRTDVGAVLHAHPPYCTGFAVAGIAPEKLVLPEAILTLGSVPIAPYGTPSTPELSDSIKPYIVNCDALLLANHGAITMGVDLMTAYHRMETLEHSARILFHAMQLGNVNTLPDHDIRKLMDLREHMKIPGRINLHSDRY